MLTAIGLVCFLIGVGLAVYIANLPVTTPEQAKSLGIAAGLTLMTVFMLGGIILLVYNYHH